MSKMLNGVRALTFAITHPVLSLQTLYVKAKADMKPDIREKLEKIIDDKEQSFLNQLGVMHGTDKADIMLEHSMETHDYLRHYDFVLSRHRKEIFTLVEFGCQEGNSLRMWRDYFPQAQIVGVDIDPETQKQASERIDIYVGDATAEKTCDDLSAKYKDIFVIVDDASHAWSDQRISFEMFWKCLTPGGYYIIEDLECGALGAYPSYPPKIMDAQPLFDYAKDRIDILRWAPDREPEINRFQFKQLPPHIQEIERSLDMAIFVPGAVIFKKKF